MNTYLSPPPLPIEYTRYADPKTICHGQIIDDCLKGDLNSDKEILVLGDSHAAMLNHFFDYLGKELGFKARIITASSCIPILDTDLDRIAEYARRPCIKQIDEVKRYLHKNNKIFIAASWTGQLKSIKNEIALKKFIKENNKDIFIISQEPLLNRNPVRSFRFNNLWLPVKVEINPEYLLTNEKLKELASQHKNTKFIELNKLPIFDFAPIYNDKPMYYDEHHINEAGAKEYAKQAKSIFIKLFNDFKFSN